MQSDGPPTAPISPTRPATSPYGWELNALNSPTTRAATAGPTLDTPVPKATVSIDSLMAGLVPSLLGVVVYAIIREGYVWFYERYGVTPEDVGIGQLQMLTGASRVIHLWKLDVPGSPATNLVAVFVGVAMLVDGIRRLCRRWGRLNPLVRQHPVAFALSVLLLVVILTLAWAVPRDRDFAGRRMQLGQAVRPTELAVLSIQADPVEVVWIGSSAPPHELTTAAFVYLGKADGVLALYMPPDWSACPVIDDCRGATWKVHETDVLLRIEVNPPDRHAPPG
jgi:hypothetical protein